MLLCHLHFYLSLHMHFFFGWLKSIMFIVLWQNRKMFFTESHVSSLKSTSFSAKHLNIFHIQSIIS